MSGRLRAVRRFQRDDDLGVVTVGELGEGVELEDRHQRRIWITVLDGGVHGADGLRTAFGLEDRRLPAALDSQNRPLSWACTVQTAACASPSATLIAACC